MLWFNYCCGKILAGACRNSMMEPESDPECTSMEGTPPPEELTPEVGGTVQEDCSDDQDLNPPDSKVLILPCRYLHTLYNNVGAENGT